MTDEHRNDTTDDNDNDDEIRQRGDETQHGAEAVQVVSHNAKDTNQLSLLAAELGISTEELKHLTSKDKLQSLMSKLHAAKSTGRG